MDHRIGESFCVRDFFLATVHAVTFRLRTVVLVEESYEKMHVNGPVRQRDIGKQRTTEGSKTRLELCRKEDPRGKSLRSLCPGSSQAGEPELCFQYSKAGGGEPISLGPGSTAGSLRLLRYNGRR